MNVPWSEEDNSSFLFFQRHLRQCYHKFYSHCVFIIYLILFYVIKRLRCFNEKKLFLHDFYHDCLLSQSDKLCLESCRLSPFTTFNQSTLYLNTLRLKAWSKYECVRNLKTLVIVAENSSLLLTCLFPNIYKILQL